MTTMHHDQLTPSVELVRELLAAQCPQWADLDLRPVASGGTANVMMRLGDELVVRLPNQRGRGRQLDKVYTWLPRLATSLPLAVPRPLARGLPQAGYPSRWLVCRWLPGDDAQLEALDDPVRAARALAGFVRALQAVDAQGGPAPGEHNFHRGVALAQREAMTQAALAALEGLIDTDAARAAWRSDRDAPPWDKPGVWLHGDLAPGNLLAERGRLSAVIDWGGLGVGDPATDLLPAWNLFRGRSREAYRRALDVDEATWARGRGLALSVALVALPYYLHSNAAVVTWARAMIDEVLRDHAATAAR